jgi:hypothetical protein
MPQVATRKGASALSPDLQGLPSRDTAVFIMFAFVGHVEKFDVQNFEGFVDLAALKVSRYRRGLTNPGAEYPES